MRKIEYVTCAVCGYRYAGKIPPGGDGSVMMPRKHKSRIHGLSFYEMQKIGTADCQGSFELAREYQDKGGEE